MLTTDKLACNILADLFEAHGVRRAVLSPGSRNAPVVVALSRRRSINCLTVVDERVAAFVALGMGVATGEPVALVCTSGTALLNYAPAVAEAFYRKVPLIVVSADRPGQWIDQDDSQTLRQPGALANLVKETCDIPADVDITPEGEWLANRLINDALLSALTPRRGPVHINLRLDAPLGNDRTQWNCGRQRAVRAVVPPGELPVARARALGRLLAPPRRVMIVAGFEAPSSTLNRALGRLAAHPNVVVLTETPSNLHSPRFIGRIDTVLSTLGPDERRLLRPDTVITTGGALVSRQIKEYLRSLDPLDHWHVGISHTTVDSLRRLTTRIDMEPQVFFRQLASAMHPLTGESDFAAMWHRAAARAYDSHERFVAGAPWSDLRAFAAIVPRIPAGWNLHLSNGTPIRYAQLFDCSRVHRTECNRGVSGIDGCTSTAIGAACATTPNVPTLLISGDMSAQYDIGALFSGIVPPTFRMIVMANGGGGIFRFIGATRSLPELDSRLACRVDVPWADIARGTGWRYFEAASEAEIDNQFSLFTDPGAGGPAMMVVRTSGTLSAELLRRYFQRMK